MILLFVLIASLLCLLPQDRVSAAGDKKKPTIKLNLETEEMVADSIKLTATVTDNKGIREFRYAIGHQELAYFTKEGKGTSVSLNGTTKTFQIKRNNTYTFYAVDAAGNTRIKRIIVSNIDNQAPELALTTPVVEGYINDTQYFHFHISDDLSGIAAMLYAIGDVEEEYFQTEGKKLHVDENGDGKQYFYKNGIYTFYVRDQVGHVTMQKVEINYMDTKKPVCDASYETHKQKATVSLQVSDNLSGIEEILYQYGNIKSTGTEKWKSATPVEDFQFDVTRSGSYTIRTTDRAGNRALTRIQVELEFRAAWITYIEYAPSFRYTQYTYNDFKTKTDKMFDTCVKEGLNAVIVHVRPFSDAYYESDYYPWSGYISGEQGRHPGFDPMAYMIEAAHERGLEFHAYLNPYRVEAKNNYDLMSPDNPARRWLEDNDRTNDRNVLLYDTHYYYNPASEEAQQLIINGVAEIVEKYDVDGIHFDDYFYPTLGTKYEKVFDYVEYKQYAKIMKASGEKPEDIATWRRNNVSNLIAEIYGTIKEINPNVVFGISPAGNLSRLRSDQQQYVDIDRWLSEYGFVDYVCPQIYWGFEHSTCPFAETTDEWIKITTHPDVKLYIGLPLYVAGTGTTEEWKNNDDIIARQVQYLRNTDFVDGFFLYRYDFLTHSRTVKEMKNLRKLLQ